MREKRDLGNEILGSLWWVLGNRKGLMKTRQNKEEYLFSTLHT
jgi:hypothetical protein